MSRFRRIVAAALLVGLTAVAVEGAETTAVTLPLFDLSAPPIGLLLVVEEERPATEPMRWIERSARLADAPLATLEGALLAYLDRVTADELDDLAELLPADAPDADLRTLRQQSRLLGLALRRIGTPERVEILRIWHFGPFRTALVEMTGNGGATIFGLGLRDLGERWALAGDWGEFQPVQIGLWYLAGNFQEGLLGADAGEPASRAAGEVLRVPPGDLPGPSIGLAFERGDASSFARRAREVAATGGDTEYLELWHVAERAEVLRLRRDSTSHYDGVRDDLASGRKATESGTAILGEYAVHYFRVGDETRTMILRRDAETGAWHLSRELYANVEMLMTSAPVRKAVARVWAEEPR